MSQDAKYLLFQTKFWTFLCNSNFCVFSFETTFLEGIKKKKVIENLTQSLRWHTSVTTTLANKAAVWDCPVNQKEV